VRARPDTSRGGRFHAAPSDSIDRIIQPCGSIVGLDAGAVGREGEVVARRPRGHDVGDVAGRQGHRPAGPDEVLDVADVQGPGHHGARGAEGGLALREHVHAEAAALAAAVEAIQALAAAEAAALAAAAHAGLDHAARVAATAADATEPALAE